LAWCFTGGEYAFCVSKVKTGVELERGGAVNSIDAVLEYRTPKPRDLLIFSVDLRENRGILRALSAGVFSGAFYMAGHRITKRK